ncbi:hypothetical protein BV97_04655 [Novosphingobium resinovorum]|uniref:Uncharacterized protein n=1 Tax=Novosphingobium resinovorum TaxID=158500 RepID=A0A031JPY3_9SPHN|nr:hypothetical protein [Novosphingobium resinovorum]EZP74917.1 hypothetical protein BV97_04655 [Novosphingobium resinovorum]
MSKIGSNQKTPMRATYDLAGPTVEDDVQRLISRYGREAVKAAIKSQAKPKKGRKAEQDWPELKDVLEADARLWLEGGDPFTARTNYSIAKAFADRNPGHSHPGTMKRITRKLLQRRIWMTLVTAENLSRDAYSHLAHLRALERLMEKDPRPIWDASLADAKACIASYHSKHGRMPRSEMTMRDVEEGARVSATMIPEAILPPSLGDKLMSAFPIVGTHQ